MSSEGLVLITRPAPEAAATVAALAAMGREGLAAPLLAIEPVPASLPPPGEIQAVIVGSINAVRHLPARYRRLPLLAVGDATAEAATARGFTAVSSAKGDARDLAALASRLCDPGGAPLLLATARGAGRPLAVDLRGRGFRVHRRVTYRVVAQPELGKAASALREGRVTAALFFSRSAGRVFARVARALRLTHTLPGITAIAISPVVAATLGQYGFRAVLTASRPDQESMLALLGRDAGGMRTRRGGPR
ncbi:uroporphyrinogen-III synthase [Elioraea rosea]|uniref:uroporphyrinogen-III synthase n=1 Tax=Elioraea rosea TaxID=2492390 RepID=UPI0011835AEB|nr:uroporphyrinogen-III synthase [Elioraea rosea]